MHRIVTGVVFVETSIHTDSKSSQKQHPQPSDAHTDHHQQTTINRPPSTDPRTFCHQLEYCLRPLTARSQPLLILGDFNAKHTSWLQSDYTDTAGDCAYYLLQTYNLHQIVQQPTHIHQNILKSCLDIAITNLPTEEALVLTGPPPLGKSDHLSIHGTITTHTTAKAMPTCQPPCWKRSWDNNRVQNLKEHLSRTQLLPDNPDIHTCGELWQHWRTKVRHSAHLLCTSVIPPQQTTPNTGPDFNRPWMTKDVLAQIKHKHCLFRQYTKTKSQADWKAFTTQRDRTCTIIRNEKNLHSLPLNTIYKLHIQINQTSTNS